MTKKVHHQDDQVKQFMEDKYFYMKWFKLILAGSVFVILACSDIKNSADRKKWIVVSSGILATSSELDKNILYNSCIGKTMLLTSDSIFSFSDCFFGDSVFGKIVNSIPLTKTDLLNQYESGDRLNSYLDTYCKGDTFSKGVVYYYNKEREQDSFDLIFNKDKNSGVIISEPYFLFIKTGDLGR